MAKKIDPANLAGRLKELRLTRQLSQGELAKLAGIPQSLVALVESGGRMPRYNSLCALANALGVTLTDLGRPAGKVMPPERPMGNPAWGRKAKEGDG